MKRYSYQYIFDVGLNYKVLEKEDQARKWCQENFGKENTDRWGLYIDGFNFKNKDDYLLFILRWA